jgi:hypothetical protein
VSGKVTTIVGVPLQGVKIWYTENGTEKSTLTDADGKYSIATAFGGTIKIDDVTKDWYDVVEGMPAAFTVTAVNVDFTMRPLPVPTGFAVTGTVTTTDGDPLEDVKISYTLNGTGMSAFTGADGKYSLAAPPGGTIVITNVTKDGYKVVEGMPPAFTAGEDNVDFTMHTVSDVNAIIPWIVVLLIGVVFLLMFMDDDEEVYGKVRRNGKAIVGATVGYTINGSSRKTVTTDKDGDYSIPVEMDDDVVITDVSMENIGTAEGLPMEIHIVKDRTRADFDL